jgi:hypothetical protein
LRFIESHNDCGFACSALINRFRFFYLRQLAFDVGAVYSPADRWEAISNQHHLHFLNFIKTKMGQKFSVEGGKDLLFPPIALYAMLTMDGASDRPLLERVAELRQEFSGLRGYFAKQTRGALETLVPDAVLASTNPKIDENIIREVSDFFDKRYLEAEFARQYGEMKRGVPSKIVRYTVPVALSLTVAGVAFAAGNWIGAAGGAVVAGVWPVATDFFKEITKDIAADKLGALGSAGIDQYRRLHFRLLQMPGVASRLQQIVQREFGCEIVLSPNNRD